MATREVHRGLRLDPETDRLLTILARKYEGNRSQTLRQLIRQAALSPEQRNQQARPATVGGEDAKR